jgi:monoamine oxidase
VSTDTQVAIVGGGLSGLNAARLMGEAGADFQLFEARDRLGGRILTVDGTGAPSGDGFDLGPSWIWPRIQPALGALVHELGLAAFGQASAGDVVFERMSREPPQRYAGPAQEPQSMRLAGGTAALVSAMAQVLPKGLGHRPADRDARRSDLDRPPGSSVCLGGRAVGLGECACA